MKKTIALLIGFLCNCALFAQLHDMQWVLARNTSILDFRNDTIISRPIANGIPFYLTNACISDENGNLLYTCYGSAVTDKDGNKLLNGDSLSPCFYTFSNPNGFHLFQAALFLPMPNNSRYYYLFHFSGDRGGNTRPGTLHYNVIDRKGNFGLGEVIDKNHLVYTNTLFRGGGMTACKHANGRDWWVIMPEVNNNKYHIFLVTSDGIKDTITQNIGPEYRGPFDNSYGCFSQDGSKFAIIAFEGYLTVFDFDRCTGILSNPIQIYNNASSDPINQPVTGGGGTCFSPNGRFVYVNDRLHLTQYDLWSSNVQDSSVVYAADSNDFAQIRITTLAPNGKIYGSTWNGPYHFLHVINNPDQKGDSCNFVWGGQPTLSSNSFVLPNMPNYRLGALIGSACDTIQTDIEQQTTNNKQLRLQPNPADKFIYTEMPMQGDYELQLLNELGQLIQSKHTRQVDIFIAEDLPSGVYFIKVVDKRNNTQLCAERVVVKH